MEKNMFGDIQRWKQYEFLFEGTNDMIFYFSNQGAVNLCNNSAIEQLGFEKGETMYMQDIFRTCIGIEDSFLTFPEEALECYYETSIYRKNKTCFPVKIRIALLEISETGSFGVCRAINAVMQKEAKRKIDEAREEINETHKERDEMVANVTHELRTPVNGVLGLAQNLLDTQLTDEQRESVELISHCCNNMTKIINNILDFSKLQSGKFTIENREFSFDKMIDKVYKTNLPAIEEKGLRLLCNVSPDIPNRMIGDELRITQVLNNLLSNALKFTAIGQIVINIVKSMDYDDEMELFFIVMDTGIGISEDEKDKLFKSFSQVDASITRKYGGTGLGLSIVKQLVNLMGGIVNVESEKGKGSTFSFSVRTKKVKEDVEEKKEEEKVEFSFKRTSVVEESNVSDIYHLGSEENKKEIKNNMERLVLCIEMGNFDKANDFANNIKTLVAEDAMDLKRKAFRLQMTIRKADYDTAMNEYKILKDALTEKFN